MVHRAAPLVAALLLPAHAAEIPASFEDFFESYCVDCHGPDRQKGDFHQDLLKISETPEDAEYWQLVLDNLHLGEMPPEEEFQPTPEEVEQVTAWIREELDRARRELAGHGDEVVLRRLNRTEYEYTIEDLFDLRGDFADGFPADMEEEGFDHIGAALMVSAAQIDAYLDAADYVLERAIVEKPRPETKSATFTLHDLNRRIWENDRKGLERRNERFDTLTPQEQKRTIEMREAFAANPHQGYGYPAWIDGEAAQPNSDMGPEIDALMASQGTGVAGNPTTSHFFQVRHRGDYRFHITAYALNHGDAPVRLKISYGKFGGGRVPTVHEVLHFTDSSPRTYETVLRLQPGDRVDFNMLEGPRWARGEKLLESPGPYLAVREVGIEGPLIDQWPPRGHRAIFGDQDLDNLDQEAVAAILARFAPKLFRRPVPAATIDEFLQLHRSFAADMTPLDALKSTLKAMMVSPQFLYHLEPPEGPDEYGLANRLAYFIWRSMPDRELMELAAAGKLSDPDVRRRQLERMLADPRSERFLHDFTDQWLQLDELGEIKPDELLYPEFDEELQRAMGEETRRFIGRLLREDLSLANLIDSDWTVLNQRLAEHYGIDGVVGGEFRVVELDRADTIRGGLLTHAAIHNVTSNGTTTSPVIRGTFILDHILGTPAPPPPPDVPAIEPDIRGATTIKQQLEQHRSIAQCASCHRKIDPYGVALENFDVIGGWRENYRALVDGPGRRPQLGEGQPVESDDSIRQLGAYADFREFRELLAAREPLVFRNLAHKLAVFALGRTTTFSDREEIERIAETTRQHHAGLRTLVTELVVSPLFEQP